MILDLRSTFGSNLSIVNAVGTTLIGSQIDRSVPINVDVDDLYLVITATSNIVAAGAGTLRFALASDTTAAVGFTNVHYQTGDIATSATTIPTGTVLFLAEVPKGSGVFPAYRRFLGLLQIVGGNAITTGTINASLTTDPGRWTAIPQALN